MFRKITLLIGVLMAFASNSLAAIKLHSLEYNALDGLIMEGIVVYDESKRGKRPAIMIAHDWMGLTKFDKDKAVQLAEQGYIAFAVDMFGKGLNPKNTDEAMKEVNKYKDDRPLLRSHIRAAYNKFITMKEVDKDKIVVMGYCFGGTTALELARDGVPLVGTASFHGGLSNPTPENASNIKGKVLIMHGADDPFVTAAEVNAFKDEMQKADVDMTFISYPGAVHAFTNPAAGNDNNKGVAYNESADKASWDDFQDFLKLVAK